jgi:hypothetical protein
MPREQIRNVMGLKRERRCKGIKNYDIHGYL